MFSLHKNERFNLMHGLVIDIVMNYEQCSYINFKWNIDLINIVWTINITNIKFNYFSCLQNWKIKYYYIILLEYVQFIR